ncbi:hypothetical protein ACROYT_G015326 [Oculina patagonica]
MMGASPLILQLNNVPVLFLYLHPVLVSEELEREIGELLGDPVALFEEHHYHALSELIFSLNTHIFKVVVGERFLSPANQASGISVKDMSDETKGKVRYCGGWATSEWFLAIQNSCHMYMGILPSRSQTVRQCTLVESGICVDALNETFTTSVTTEEIKEIHLEQYRLLVNTGCSKFFKLFICLAHLHFCSPLHPDISLQPCQSLCEHIYQNCIKYYILATPPRPEHLNWSCFPRKSLHRTIFIYCFSFISSLIVRAITDHTITVHAIPAHAITNHTVTFQASTHYRN